MIEFRSGTVFSGVVGFADSSTNSEIYNNIFVNLSSIRNGYQTCIHYYRPSSSYDGYHEIYNNIFINFYWVIRSLYVVDEMNIYNNFFQDNDYILSSSSSGTVSNVKVYNNISCNYRSVNLSQNYSGITTDTNYRMFNTSSMTGFSNVCLFIPDFLGLVKHKDMSLNLNVCNNANSSLVPNVDINNNPRPLDTGCDIGPIEYNPPEEKETTEKRTGSYSLKLTNASFKDIKTFLSAGSYTVSVYVKWSGYSGSDKPQLIVKQDKYCGINSDQIATATGGGTSWEQLSVNITLTEDAEITIRLYARDTGSSAVTYFDDLDIS